MGLFGRARTPQAAPTPPPAYVERLELLEDGLKRLERRFVKLQGELSATIQHYEQLLQLDDEYEDLDDVRPQLRREG